MPAAEGEVVFHGNDLLREIEELGEPRTMSAEQSNASIAFGDKVILKLYRRLREGMQPDVEVARFLTEVAGFDEHPRLPRRASTTVATRASRSRSAPRSRCVQNQGDAWAHAHRRARPRPRARSS